MGRKYNPKRCRAKVSRHSQLGLRFAVCVAVLIGLLILVGVLCECRDASRRVLTVVLLCIGVAWGYQNSGLNRPKIVYPTVIQPHFVYKHQRHSAGVDRMSLMSWLCRKSEGLKLS